MTKAESVKIAKQIKKSPFFEDIEVNLDVNGKNIGRGMYNLIVSIRDFGLYSKGIRPHRNWKITPVKKYFGVTGSAEKCLEQLEAYKEFLTQ